MYFHNTNMDLDMTTPTLKLRLKRNQSHQPNNSITRCRYIQLKLPRYTDPQANNKILMHGIPTPASHFYIEVSLSVAYKKTQQHAKHPPTLAL